MPVTLKTGVMKYRKSDGTYSVMDALMQEPTQNQISAIETAGQEQVDAVEQKGQDILDSLPEDYTELETDVGELKSAINNKISEPTTAGTNGQVLTCDGNGGASWEDTTGGSNTEFVELFTEPSISYSNQSTNVTDNGNGTFTIGTANYGCTEFDSPIWLPAGKYQLFGASFGFTYISTSQGGYSNPVAINEDSTAKVVTISETGNYYVGHRTPSAPSEPFTITPSLKEEQNTVAQISDIYTLYDVIITKSIGTGSNNPAVTDNGDGTFTIGASSWGTLMVGPQITLPAGVYTIFGTPDPTNGFSFITENSTINNAGTGAIVINPHKSPKRFYLSEQKTVYIGYRNKAKPSADYIIAPYLYAEKYKFVTGEEIASLEAACEQASTAAQSVATAFDEAVAVPLTENIGYTLYPDGSGGLTGPTENSARGYTSIAPVPGTSVTIKKVTGVRVYISERIRGCKWMDTADIGYNVTEYTHIFDESSDLFFLRYVVQNTMPSGTIAMMVCNNVLARQRITAAEYIFEKYRQMAVALKRQNSSTEATTECAFKALLVTDVHMQEARMAVAKNLVNQWGTTYFDALINAGDTANVSTDDVSWYATLMQNLVVRNINVIGNHDAANVAAQVAYERIIAPLVGQTGLVQPENASVEYLGYYYVDFAKVRVICLDSTNWTEAQASWLETTLTSARTNNLAVICVSHYAFSPEYATHIKCNWSITDNRTAYTNIVAAEKVYSFIQAGGEFICWLTGHEHSDGLYVLSDYGKQLVVSLAGMITRATQIYPNPEDYSYNFSCMTYFSVDNQYKTIRMMRIGADIDMHGVKHSGVSLDYGNGELIASW